MSLTDSLFRSASNNVEIPNVDNIENSGLMTDGIDNIISSNKIETLDISEGTGIDDKNYMNKRMTDIYYAGTMFCDMSKFKNFVIIIVIESIRQLLNRNLTISHIPT